MHESVIRRDGWKVCGGMSKTGRGCGVLKPLEAFHRHRKFADGRNTICAECAAAEKAAAKLRNPKIAERERVGARARYWKDPEKHRERTRERRVRQRAAFAAASD